MNRLNTAAIPMLVPFIIIVFVCGCAPIPSPMKTAPAPDPEASIVAAWEKLGFQFVHLKIDKDSSISITDNKDPGSIPGFRVTRESRVVANGDFPTCDVPFGLLIDSVDFDSKIFLELSNQPNLHWLCLRYCIINDDIVTELAKMRGLTHMQISDISKKPNITDNESKFDFNKTISEVDFGKFQKLISINFSHTQLDDVGCKALLKAKSICEFDLSSTYITDIILDLIAERKSCRTIDYSNTLVTREGNKRFVEKSGNGVKISNDYGTNKSTTPAPPDPLP